VRILLLTLLALSAGLVAAPLHADWRDTLADALADERRSDQEKARDANRKPLETLDFFKFNDDMTVLELIPGGGWYTKLLAPVLRNAETKRLRAIAQEISDLADRARNRKLSPDEISGGTFTISNNGSAGSVLTMPIINQPQVAIISTDAIVRKPVAVRGADGGEAIAIHPVGNLAMSWDHRAFDGAYAAGFLKKVKEILETRDWSAEL